MNLERALRVPPRGFRLAEHDPGDTGELGKDEAAGRREADLGRLADLQERLYAEGRRALLIVLQGLDASGKDGTVKHVMGGVNPQGVTVTSFKQPSQQELAHDFLQRTQLPLPARGQIGVYNRSHYEEVLVVRVHPELLAKAGENPARAQKASFWKHRFEDIGAWERHLTHSGTRVIKFFLHVSKAEQRRRFLERAELPEKHWKFSVADMREHGFFNAYQEAYQAALAATSTEEEPWYVIPADHKWFMRTAVAAIVVHHLADLNPQFPKPTAAQLELIERALAELRAER